MAIKFRHVFGRYVNRIPIVVYSAAPFDVGDVFISAPVVDEGKSVLLFTGKLTFSISFVVSQSERNAVLHTVGNISIDTLAAPAICSPFYIGDIADIHKVGGARLRNSNIIGIENREIQPGFFGNLGERPIDSLAAVGRVELSILSNVAAVGLQQLLEAPLRVIGEIVGRINLAGRRDDLKVQVRTVCIAGFADTADLLAAHNCVALPNVDLRQVGVKRYRTVRVRDLHQVAVGVIISFGNKAVPLLRYSHGAVICGDDRRTGRSADVPCAVLCAVTLRDLEVLRHRPRVCCAGFGVDHRIVVNVGVCDRHGRCRGLRRGRRGNCRLRRRWDSGGLRSFRRFIRRRCCLRCGGRRWLYSRFRRHRGRCFRCRLRCCCGLRYGCRRRLCGRFHGGLRRWFWKVGRCYGSSPGGTCRGRCLVCKRC